MEPFESLRGKTETRLHRVQKGLEFQIDWLSDNVHKLEQRVTAAKKLADKVLGRSAASLRERDHRVRRNAGTEYMPLMAVLGGLGKTIREPSRVANIKDPSALRYEC